MVKKKDRVFAHTHPTVRQMIEDEKRPLRIWVACLAWALLGTVLGWVVS